MGINRRKFLLSALAICTPVVKAKEEFATLKFIPINSVRKPVKNNTTTPAKDTGRQSHKKIVMIDPGHGGKDPRAIGHKGTQEKHIVLEIANHVRDILMEHDNIEVKLTREDDFFIPLYERVNIAHRHDADLFMSIHADGFTSPQAHGASVYALSTRGASSTMARYMSQKENSADDFAMLDVKTADENLQRTLFDMEQTHNISRSLKLCSHMIKHIRQVHTMHSPHPEQAAFVVLKSPTIPSVLIETSFITNPEEERILGTRAFRLKIATAIAQGVQTFLQLS